MNVLYKTSATATGGRDGPPPRDGALDVKLPPKELGGDGGAGTNPEQLFAAGYSACFIGAMKFVAGQGLRCRPMPRSPPRSASARARKAASASTSTSRSPAGHGPRGRRDAGREGARGLPVLQRHPRQCRCRA